MILDIAADIAKGVLNTLADLPIYKIHPAIGVARVGNASPDDFFIGPELPGEPSNPTPGFEVRRAPGGKFKVNKKIRRQAARFHIYEYVPDPKTPGKRIPKEVKLGEDPNVADIFWTVQLANRKASYYEFSGTTGLPGPGHYPASHTLRNKKIFPGDQAKRSARLDIDPGPKKINGPNAKGIEFKNPIASIPIQTLGELRTDPKGRLLVLGAEGRSGPDTTLPDGPKKDDDWAYANNDSWFDDISDGPVTAVVKLKSGKMVPVLGAWVLVGPPDYAPGIGSVVSLFDTLYDIAARKLATPPDDTIYTGYKARLRELKTAGSGVYQPFFIEEIKPTLQSAFNAAWVYGEFVDSFHGMMSPTQWAKLGDPADASMNPVRKQVFESLRPPAGNTEYESGQYMPLLFGDNYDLDPGDLKFSLALTETQNAFFHQWSQNHFRKGAPKPPGPAPTPTSTIYTIVKDDWLSKIAPRYGMTWQQLYAYKGDTDIPNSKRLRSGNPDLIYVGEQILVPASKPSPAPAPAPAPAGDGESELTPEGLDQAAAENCVGGAFFPGIEVSWLIRDERVFLEPLRINQSFTVDADPNVPSKAAAGYFSRQMALPWQADFYDCAKEEKEVSPGHKVTFGWWPAQRPDIARGPDPADATKVKELQWDRGIGTMREFTDFTTGWATRGFIVPKATDYQEEDGP
jgi:L-Lysine epsilon oxidase N-terminal/L-lysine epsilon oxidase C-terminal domain/LysM domain